MYNLFIVDDHPLMREGLAMILESQPDFNIVAMAGSAEEAMENIEKHRVDLLIVDISLPGMSGLELVKHMSALKPTLKMLVMSRHDEQLYAERVIRSGAKGYVMKVEARKVIIEAIRKILGGGIYISDAINERLIQSMMPGRRPIGQSPLEILSDRELEIFEMTGRGYKSGEIAERLHISPKTVESYRTRIKDKLSLTSAAELMKHAVQWVESSE
ncbi:MAG: response regulator transcription factor [Rhodothermia bacterium]|nr:response regulator transcription factor [Rhodothermia bacterium]